MSGDLLARAAAQAPQKPALVAEDRSLTYAQLERAANRVANALLRRGVAPGERIALRMPNGWEYAAAYFGIARAGAVSVHIPLRFTDEELAYVRTKIPLRELSLDDCSRDAETAPALAVDPDGPAAILFTSGTTGYPKGAVQPRRGRELSAQAALRDFGLGESDVMALATPLYHAAGLYTWFQTGVLARATVVFFSGWDPAQFMREAARRGITAAFAVPTQLAMLLRHPQFDPKLLASLRLVVFGGAPCDPALIQAVERALPQVRFVQNYGQTETGPLFSQQPEERARQPRSLGRANPLIEVELFAERGRPAAPGEIGEIATRGPHLMLGYFGDEAATREFFRAGDDWGWTGDLAQRDGEGFITLLGRRNDTIISGGVKIYPVEIERVLLEHPAVADCAAVGVKDEVWGELPAVAVVLKAGSPASEEELLRFSEDRMARHKRPRQARIVEALPYTPAGKLMRARLKALFGASETCPAPAAP